MILIMRRASLSASFTSLKNQCITRYMTQNLETADTIIKLTLASSVIVLRMIGALSGPFATPIVILAVIVIILTIVRMIARTRHR
jgi:hypothetical protein